MTQKELIRRKTNQPPKILWQTSVQASCTVFDFPPFWLASKQILFKIKLIVATDQFEEHRI